MPGDFTRHPDYDLGAERIKKALREAVGSDGVAFIDASKIATRLLGNALAANMFMLGYAFQLGKVPLSAQSIEHAITMNGEAVDMNLAAFFWGRVAAHEPEKITALIEKSSDRAVHSETLPLDDLITRLQGELKHYQSSAYAKRYLRMIEKVRRAEEAAIPGETALTEAVARALFKLMAIKDEYEVARLYTDGRFKKQLDMQFETYDSIEFHLAPPMLGKRDAQGHPVKSVYGPKMMWAFRVLASLRFLRATPFDVFGYTQERRLERRLIRDYLAMIEGVLPVLDAAHHSLAVDIAALPMQLRGYGHVKMRHLEALTQRQDALLAAYHSVKDNERMHADAAE